uniref:Gag-pol polyprotein n=1 Tax=Gossypium raimondii TaxID=29730 RepID=A0A0D2RX93_GOSRA|nr:hypothetical protein B456_012G038500 [Gossypium raimondii]
MLTTKFKTLRMQNNELSGKFYAKLYDLSNQLFALESEHSNLNLVKKVLRSLPEQFNINVTVIKEDKDFDTMRIDELIGPLQTFKINMDETKRNMSKEQKSMTL